MVKANLGCLESDPTTFPFAEVGNIPMLLTLIILGPLGLFGHH